MRLFIGADHRGFQLKKQIVDELRREGHDVVDEGDNNYTPGDDFPQFAGKTVTALLAYPEEALGILLCGSGQGMCIAANRFKGIRACLGYNTKAARASRSEDDSNVLCLPADHLTSHEALDVVQAWLTTDFAAAPRYVRRNYELDQLT